MSIRVTAPATHFWSPGDQVLIRFRQAEADAIRAAGEAVIPRIEARHWPFDGSLIDWRPDPAWPMPTMPPTWNDD